MKIKPFVFFILFLSICLLFLNKGNLVYSITIYDNAVLFDNTSSSDIYNISNHDLLILDKSKIIKSFLIIKSNIIVNELKNMINKAYIVEEVDFPCLDLSFLEDNSISQKDPSTNKVPISIVDLNPKFILLTKYLNGKKEVFYIGNSDYIKFNNLYYFVGIQNTNKLIKKISN